MHYLAKSCMNHILLYIRKSLNVIYLFIKNIISGNNGNIYY